MVKNEQRVENRKIWGKRWCRYVQIAAPGCCGLPLNWGFVRVGVHFTMSTAELELLGSAVDPWTVFICFHVTCGIFHQFFLQHPGILWYFCTMYNKFRHVCFTSQQSTHRRNRIGWQGTAGDCYLPTVSAWRLASGIIVSVRPSRRSPGVSLE